MKVDWIGETPEDRSPGWYLYVYFDAKFTPVYVGITNDPDRRCSQHQSQSVWMKDVWFGLADGPYETRTEVAAREAELIEMHRPVNNTQHNPARATTRSKVTVQQALARAADSLTSLAMDLA